MNAIDYSQKMADLKNDFRDKFDQNRRTQDREIESLNETHKMREKSQRKNYDASRAEFEVDIAEDHKKFSEKTDRAIDEKRKLYLDKVQNLEDDFFKQRISQKKDHATKFDSITNSYNKSLEDIEGVNKIRLMEMDERNDRQLQMQRNKYKNVIDDMGLSSEERFKNLSSKQNKIQKRLAKEQKIEVKDLNSRNRNTKIELQKKFRNEKEMMGDAHNSEVRSLNYKLENAGKEERINNEAEVADRTKVVNEKNKRAINKKREYYSKRLNEYQMNNAEERRLTLKKYNLETNKLKSAYDRSTDNETKRHYDIENRNKLSYGEKYNKVSDKFEKKISKLMNKSDVKFKQLQKNTNAEKAQMQRDISVERNQSILDGNLAKNKLNSEHQLETQKNRDSQAARILELKEHQRDALAEIYAQKSKEKDELKENFKAITDKMANKNKYEESVRRRELHDTQNRLEQKFSTDIKNVKRDYMKRFTGKGGKIEQFKDRNKSLVESYDKRIVNLKNKINDVEYSNIKSLGKISDENKKELQLVEDRQYRELQKRDQELFDYKKSELVKIKDRSEKVIDQYKTKLLKNQTAYDERSIEKRKKNRADNDLKRIEFNNVINEITRKNVDGISSMQSQFMDEKTKYIQDVKRGQSREKAELKENLVDQFSKKEKSLDKRIDQILKDNDKMMVQYEKKLSVLRANSRKETEKRNVIEKERYQSSAKDFKRELKTQDDENFIKMHKLRNDFERKISHLRNDQDEFIEQLTDRYENKLEIERDDARKVLRMEKQSAKDSVYNQRSQNILEREALVQKYEIQIDNLRQMMEIERNKKES